MIKKSPNAAGGVARAQKLSPEKRSEIAHAAAAARWGVPKATHQGELAIGDIRIPCAVLDDGRRVLTENGITNALLGSRSGASKRLKKTLSEAGAPAPLFLAPERLKPFISNEMLDGPLVPVQYLDGARTVTGFDATILPSACEVWLKARDAGALQSQQLDKAQRAEMLMRGLASGAGAASPSAGLASGAGAASPSAGLASGAGAGSGGFGAGGGPGGAGAGVGVGAPPPPPSPHPTTPHNSNAASKLVRIFFIFYYPMSLVILFKVWVFLLLL